MIVEATLSTEDLRFFTVVAGSVSLAAAARSLDVTPPAVTQRLRHLEGRLGVRLVERTTRRLRLTQEGQLLVDRAQVALAGLDDIAETLRDRRGVVGGHLRLAAPLGFGRRYVAPVVAAFRKLNPGVKVTLSLTDRPAVAAEESWDLVIHIGELRDSSRVMHRLAPNRRFVCASPSYIAQRGEPLTPADLQEHSCIALRQNDEDVTLWRFTDRSRKSFAIRINSSMTSNDGETIRAWACDGLGVILRSEWDLAEDLRSGRLQRVLPGYRVPSADIVALMGGRGDRTARAREFLRLLQAALRPVPWGI